MQSKSSRFAKPARGIDDLEKEVVKTAKPASTQPQVSLSSNIDAHPLEGLVADLLNPTVSDAKRDEYEWYVYHTSIESMVLPPDESILLGTRIIKPPNSCLRPTLQKSRISNSMRKTQRSVMVNLSLRPIKRFMNATSWVASTLRKPRRPRASQR